MSDEVVPNVFWHRIFKAFSHRDVLITIGTGEISPIEEEGLSLASEHAYAVLDLKEEDDRCFLLVKNPWLGTTTRKIYSGSTHTHRTRHFGASSDLLSTGSSDGRSWVDLKDILQDFECIHLNWNSGLFSHREDFHFKWHPNRTKGCFENNPQYNIRSAGGDFVWLLLNRHFQTQGGAEAGYSEVGFISLYAFDTGGKRVILSDDSLARSPYVDSPNTLLRIKFRKEIVYTVVVSEQRLLDARYIFTLSAFSTKPIHMSEAQDHYPYKVKLRGAWTVATAGGNAKCPTYHNNPQYKLEVRRTSKVAMLIAASSNELAVNIKLVWGQGKRVTSITSRDVFGDSGEYRMASALAEIRSVPAGAYTIVCSTFEPGHFGDFDLSVKCTSEPSVHSISFHEPGRVVTRPSPALLTPDLDRLLAPLHVSRITRLRLSASMSPDAFRDKARSPVKIAIEYGQGPNKQILAESNAGEYTDRLGALRTEDVDVQPSMCGDFGLWIVIERLGSAGMTTNEEVNIEIYSDVAVVTSAWGTGDG